MALITIEGVYENGKVELVESPAGVERAKVMVTFLPETSAARTKAGRKGRTAKIQNQAAPVEPDRYPQALRDEYQALISTKLRRALTSEDVARLETVRAEINRRDRESASWSAWEQRATEVDREISNLRRELEALPDA